MHAFSRMVFQDTKNLFMNKMWLVLSFGFPLCLTLVLGVLTEGLFGQSITSYDFYGVTILIYSALMSATFASNSFLEAPVKQANLRMIYAPVRSWFVPVTKGAATFVFTSVNYSIVGLFFYLGLGINYGKGMILLMVWLLFLLLNLFSCAIGIFFSCVFKSEETTNQVISLVLNLLAVFSGLMFSVASLGDAMLKISRFSPVTKVVQTIFEMIYDEHTTQFGLSVGILTTLTCILFIGTGTLFKGEDFL